MSSALSPLPAPFPGTPQAAPRPELAVEHFPVPAEPSIERPKRLSLPELGSFTRFTGDPVPAPRMATPMPNPPPDFTDVDLRDALVPLVAGAMSGDGFRDDASLEAILRATFRRALAEQQGGPFQAPDATHRVLWRLQALFTSRSYDEVLAEKIRRFHVEEVYLLDRDKLSLVSYASSDPVRHAHPRRVGSFARQLALRVVDDSGALQLGFELGEGRRTFVRPGQFCHLVAVIRGEVNDLVKADLDFALKRIETRYRVPFVRGQPLLQELQPLLEECLLIHSPAAPAGA